MGNFDSTKKASNKKKTDDNSNTAKVRWSYIQADLDNAASEWSKPTAPVKTPDEEQLEKVKNIIENLKDKLNEF